MIAHLYICNRSFRWNGIDELSDFQQKLVGFQKMMERIKRYPEENLLFLFSDSFLKTEVLEHVTMSDIITNYDKAITLIGRESYILLVGMMKSCRSTHATIWDLKSYLSLEDENLCHAVIVFTPIKGLDGNLQLISTEQGWFDFRRHYLGKYPQTPSFFLSESPKYFPCLKLHPNNCTTMRSVLRTHPMKIVSCLSALNDSFIGDFFSSGKDLQVFLPLFAKGHGIEDASLEGTKAKKFYFKFEEERGIVIAYCEAHLKMYQDDRGNSNQHCRIYFRKPVEGESYIYVGYIGEHL